MKRMKYIVSFTLLLSILIPLVSITANALKVNMVEGDYGYIVPTNAKGTKPVTTLNLYGKEDYINFHVKSIYVETHFFYEIYSDKDYKNRVDSGYCYSEEPKEFNVTARINLKEKYKTGTYYGLAYVGFYKNKNKIKISQQSIYTFKISVDRSPSFKEKIVMLNNTKNTANGPKISWSKISGATQYNIYRRAITRTSWKKVGMVDADTRVFTDTSVKNKNCNYIYTVRGVNKNGVASRFHYMGLTTLFAKAPVLKSVTVASNDRVKITWKSIKSGSSYEIYRKEVGTSKWEKLATGHNSTTYYDKTAESGKIYIYTVKGSFWTNYGKTSSGYYQNSDKQVEFIKAPVINPLTVTENSIQLTWNPVENVIAYSVFRKSLANEDDWELLERVSPDVTSYEDTTADLSGGAYIYTVRSEGTKNPGSYYNKTEYSYVIPAKPKGVKVRYEDEYKTEIIISWKKAEYAESYEVFYRESGGEWKLLGEVNRYHNWIRHYVRNDMAIYEYKVRSVRKAGFKSELSAIRKFEHYPEIDYVWFAPRNKKMSMEWSNIYADSYNVYRKQADQYDSEYVFISNVTEPKCLDTTTEYDVLYTYKIIPVLNNTEVTENQKISNAGIKSVYNVTAPEMKVDIDYYRFNTEADIYGYNYSTGEWECFKTSNWCKSNYEKMSFQEKYTQDGKTYRYAFVYDENGMKTDLEKSIIDYEWFSEELDYDISTKNTLNIKINNPSSQITKFKVVVNMEQKTIIADGSSSYTVKFKISDVVSSEKYEYVKIYYYTQNGDELCTGSKYSIIKKPEISAAERLANGNTDLTICSYKHGRYSNEYFRVDGYYIYRKAEGEKSWTKIDTIPVGTTKKNKALYTKYTDETAEKGITYTYTVKAYYDIAGERFVSYYDTKGVTV